MPGLAGGGAHHGTGLPPEPRRSAAPAPRGGHGALDRHPVPLGPDVRTDVSELLRLLTALDAARERGDPAAAGATAEEARALFRGTPFADLGADVARGPRRRLEEMRDLLDETRAGALGELGRTDEAVVAWRTLVDAGHTTRAGGQLLTALHAAGRRAEALEAYQEARQRLLDDLGFEPGAVLTTAHRAVIDDRLDPLTSPVEEPVPRQELAAQVRSGLATTGLVVLTGEPRHRQDHPRRGRHRVVRRSRVLYGSSMRRELKPLSLVYSCTVSEDEADADGAAQGGRHGDGHGETPWTTTGGPGPAAERPPA